MDQVRILKPRQPRSITLPPPVLGVWVGFCLKCDQPFRKNKEQVVCAECSKDLKRRVCH